MRCPSSSLNVLTVIVSKISQCNGCSPTTSTLVKEMLNGLESHLITGMFTIVSRDRQVPTRMYSQFVLHLVCIHNLYYILYVSIVCIKFSIHLQLVTCLSQVSTQLKKMKRSLSRKGRSTARRRNRVGPLCLSSGLSNVMYEIIVLVYINQISHKHMFFVNYSECQIIHNPTGFNG